MSNENRAEDDLQFSLVDRVATLERQNRDNKSTQIQGAQNIVIDGFPAGTVLQTTQSILNTQVSYTSIALTLSQPLLFIPSVRWSMYINSFTPDNRFPLGANVAPPLTPYLEWSEFWDLDTTLVDSGTTMYRWNRQLRNASGSTQIVITRFKVYYPSLKNITVTLS